MSVKRSPCVLVILLLSVVASGQHMQGYLPASFAGRYVYALVSRGSGMTLIDSARVKTNGGFDLGDPSKGAGFYHLAVNDSDAVDLILEPSESMVEVRFDGVPLQQHITVSRSEENKRLWQYKYVSRETQAVIASLMAEKSRLAADDVRRITELDSIGERALRVQRSKLEQVLRSAPQSYFAKVIRTDDALDELAAKSPMDVARIFDFSDASLMRSTIYDKAVMTFLRNVNALTEEQFIGASDTLIALASRDPSCRSYMIDHLIDLYSTYGPDMPLQHIIDTYVVKAGLESVAPELRQKVSELLKVAVGAVGPDPVVPTPKGELPLSTLVAGNKVTVLFFYSSTCDHCHKQMQPLKEIHEAERGKGLGVLGIALDTDSADFKRNISERGLPWPSYSEFNAWGGKAVKAYQVKATPSLIVIDRQRRILAKPVDAADLRRWLDEHPL